MRDRLRTPTSSSSVSETDLAPSGAVGNRRVSIQASWDGQHENAAIIYSGVALFYAYSSDAVFTLEYGVSSPMNLLLPGDAFKFEMLWSNLSSGSNPDAPSLTTTLTSGAGVTESVTQPLALEGEHVVPFALFDLTDFTDVDYISFALDATGNPGAIFLIGEIVDPALPEPATITLFGFGLLGLAAASRRRLL